MPRKTLKRCRTAKKDVYASFKMPKPDLKYGHSAGQIQKMLDVLGINTDDFYSEFGVNTVAVDEKGNTCFYGCDIERALHSLTKGKVGAFHGWD
jgi:hypothetical protein